VEAIEKKSLTLREIRNARFPINLHRRLRVASIEAMVLAMRLRVFPNKEVYLTPTLRRFEREYANPMRSVAGLITGSMRSPEERLAEGDVGVLAYSVSGRFRLYDGSGAPTTGPATSSRSRAGSTAFTPDRVILDCITTANSLTRQSSTNRGDHSANRKLRVKTPLHLLFDCTVGDYDLR
jgi:hypothetical protein